MLMTVDVKKDDIINSINSMNINELEEIKEALLKNNIYFKKYNKIPIDEVIDDFSKNGYSKDFLDDLENGLQKSSIYQK